MARISVEDVFDVFDGGVVKDNRRRMRADVCKERCMEVVDNGAESVYVGVMRFR